VFCCWNWNYKESSSCLLQGSFPSFIRSVVPSLVWQQAL
jgi:hypothetical protein